MDDGQGGLHPGVGQIGIVGEQLRRQEHALVKQRAAGHRRNVELIGPLAEHFAHAAFGAFAGDVKASLQVFVLASPAVQERLANDGFGRSGQFAQAAVVGGHVAPAEHGQSLGVGLRREGLLATGTKLAVVGQEEHPHAVMPLRWKRKAQAFGLGAKELVGDLHENARAVAGRFVGARCAAVHEIQQHLPAVLDDGVAAASGNIDDGADAASIVFPLRVV